MSAPASPAKITVSYGDGIGPEIMKATLRILEQAGAALDIETIEIGQKVFERGASSGIEAEAWESLRRTQAFLKAPVTTPQGQGFKSINVTIRKRLGLYANVRPCVSYHPYVSTKHPTMDVVIVRENEEETYAGIEHRQTSEVTQCLKLISQPGSERIVRYAYEYALSRGRKKVTCFTKDNIMKMTDGLFHHTFDELGESYPSLEKEHWIIDIGCAKLADRPEQFDVLVLPNLYGDVLSDVAAEIAGSVGLCGSANLGENAAMFEAIHGSAPDIAGKGIANPSGLVHGALMMLAHLGQGEVAERIHNAWLRTLEDGIHTGDIYEAGQSEKLASTQEFADAVIERLGQVPTKLETARYPARKPLELPRWQPRPRPVKALVGIDVFVDWAENDRQADALAARVRRCDTDSLQLKLITNRGVTVWPGGFPETFCTDHWRCRFRTESGSDPISTAQILELLGKFHQHGLDFIKTEHLYTFDGELGFSLGQGE